MPLLENFAYGYSFLGPEPKTLDHHPDEVTYLFLKGYGWVPETELSLGLELKQKQEARDKERMFNPRQAAMPANFGMPYGFDVADFNAYELRIQQLQEQFRQDMTHRWFIEDDITFDYVPQQIPRQQREPREPRTFEVRLPDRYFQGAGVTVERQENEEEDIHTRRIREYQDAQRRWRRR